MRYKFVPHTFTLEQLKKASPDVETDLYYARLGIEVSEKADQQLPQACRILGVELADIDRSQLIRDALTILMFQDVADQTRRFRKTDHSAAAEKFRAAISRAKIHARKLPLAARHEVESELRSLTEWTEEFAEAARTSAGATKESGHKRRAAELAFHLLCGHKEVPTSATKRTPFRMLAELLAGDDTAGMEHHCRRVLQRANRPSK